jgi:hypothetical protein
MSKQEFNRLKIEDFRSRIDRMSSDVAARFDVYDFKGRPRRTFILDTLYEYSSLECIVKVFAQQYMPKEEVDSIFGENHRLASNLLVEYLRSRLSEEGISDILIQREVDGDYGRVDVLISGVTSCGLLIKHKRREVIVEIKTGRGLSYSQILRYFLGRPGAGIIVWQIAKRRFFSVPEQLLLAYSEIVIRRGTRLLDSADVMPCGHDHANSIPYFIENPGELLDNFGSVLLEKIPEVADAILQILKTCEPVQAE